MSELGMALLMKSDAAALLTDFEGDALRQSAAAPAREAQQRSAADDVVTAHASIEVRSPGCTEFAALYESQSRGPRPQTVAGDDPRTDESRTERYGPSETPAARQPEASSANASAASDFTAYGFTPQSAYIDSREERRQERGRSRREPERREEVAPQEQPGYTIDDIVQFAGVTIAERHTPPAALA